MGKIRFFSKRPIPLGATIRILPTSMNPQGAQPLPPSFWGPRAPNRKPWKARKRMSIGYPGTTRTNKAPFDFGRTFAKRERKRYITGTG